jgi:hypothetical protein
MPYPSSLLDAIALAALIVSLGAIAFLLIAIRCILRFEGARLASDLPLPR